MHFNGVICDACKTPIEAASRDDRTRLWERVVIITNGGVEGLDRHETADVCNDCSLRWFIKILEVGLNLIREAQKL